MPRCTWKPKVHITSQMSFFKKRFIYCIDNTHVIYMNGQASFSIKHNLQKYFACNWIHMGNLVCLSGAHDVVVLSEMPSVLNIRQCVISGAHFLH